MLVPITPARFPDIPVSVAKQDAELLAWLGTAYGRRVPKQNPIETPARSVGQVVVAEMAELGNPKAHRTNFARWPNGPLVVLGAVLIALLAMRAMPIAHWKIAVPSPPALDPVYDPQPTEAKPHIEAWQQPASGLPATRSAAVPPHEPVAAQETAVPQVAPVPQETQAPAENPALSIAARNPELPRLNPIEPQAVLPPAVPLGPSTVPAAEARLAAAPAPIPLLPGPVPGPEPVAVLEGRIAVVLPPPALSTNLPAQTRPIVGPVHPSRNADIIEGQAHFAKGDLPSARAAFAKAFESGLPEAALALGNTFDPVSLAKAGVKAKGDPALARRWYRRAFELAMRRPNRSRS